MGIPIHMLFKYMNQKFLLSKVYFNAAKSKSDSSQGSECPLQAR